MKKIQLMIKALFLLIPAVLAVGFLLRWDNTGVETAPKATLRDVVSGSYQSQFEVWFNSSFTGSKLLGDGYRRWKYDAFRELSGTWTVGKDAYLFNGEQSASYVSKQKSISNEQFDEYAKKIYEVENAMFQNGKTLFIILTPYKGEIYTEKLPLNQRIVYLQKKEDNDWDATRLVNALQNNGVTYYDTLDFIKQLKENEYVPTFYETGVHWTNYTAALTINEVFRSVSESGQVQLNLPTIQIENVRTSSPSPVEVDVYNIVGVPNIPMAPVYYTQDFSYKNPSDKRAVIFGTSFSNQIMEVLAPTGMPGAFSEFAYFNYFTQIYDNANGNRSLRQLYEGMSLDEIGVRDYIEKSDIIILEQQRGFGTMHSRLIDFLYDMYCVHSFKANDTIYVGTTDWLTMTGWHPLEAWGRWSAQQVSSMEFDYSGDNSVPLKLHLTTVSTLTGSPLHIACNGQEIGVLDINEIPAEYDVTIPAGLIGSNGKVELVFSLEKDVISPQDLGTYPDSRKTGFSLGSITLSEGLEG